MAKKPGNPKSTNQGKNADDHDDNEADSVPAINQKQPRKQKQTKSKKQPNENRSIPQTADAKKTKAILEIQGISPLNLQAAIDVLSAKKPSMPMISSLAKSDGGSHKSWSDQMEEEDNLDSSSTTIPDSYRGVVGEVRIGEMELHSAKPAQEKKMPKIYEEDIEREIEF